MNNKQRFFVSFAILAILVFGLYFFTDWFSKVTGYFTGEEDKVKLGQCLSGKNAELYTSPNYCKDCERQEKELGKALKYLTKITCEMDSNSKIITESCKNLKSLPAIYVNNTAHYGFKNLTEIRSLSGCID